MMLPGWATAGINGATISSVPPDPLGMPKKRILGVLNSVLVGIDIFFPFPFSLSGGIAAAPGFSKLRRGVGIVSSAGRQYNPL